MCRSIKPLFNFDPPIGDVEIRAASVQFVRKISGFHKPSKTNEAAFSRAIDEITEAAFRLLNSLETSAPARSRNKQDGNAKDFQMTKAQTETHNANGAKLEEPRVENGSHCW